MAINRKDVRAKYAKAMRPPTAIYSRWWPTASGGVTRELMPSFVVRDRKVPDGYAVKDSPEDIENEREARQFVPAPKAPARSGPPPVHRLRPGR